ncbi:hypothetical protein [Parvularcula sp. IMCC14364]|uniref:hypothetical protein n=1 Tax=Parvularcula sp. IMCC14364 TaxID=3067902 RepID=UPI00274045F5|nr:hypothetical protein [Parvularcula sp. IMCC14364]
MDSQIQMEQYAIVRHEMFEQMKLRDDCIKFVAVANAAVASWLMTNPVNDSQQIVYWLPFLLTSVFFVRYRVFSSRIHMRGIYSLELEKQLGLIDGIGWQHYWNANRGNIVVRSVTTTDFFVWILLFLSAGWFGVTFA